MVLLWFLWAILGGKPSTVLSLEQGIGRGRSQVIHFEPCFLDVLDSDSSLQCLQHLATMPASNGYMLASNINVTPEVKKFKMWNGHLESREQKKLTWKHPLPNTSKRTTFSFRVESTAFSVKPAPLPPQLAPVGIRFLYGNLYCDLDPWATAGKAIGSLTPWYRSRSWVALRGWALS